jgi:hypothetical protein
VNASVDHLGKQSQAVDPGQRCSVPPPVFICSQLAVPSNVSSGQLRCVASPQQTSSASAWRPLRPAA